ncbi:MAG TPA: hypothetical protein PKE16_15395 [Hyphomicrobium sp.]|nr:hypothetical protein [Hyphomicrobium sp.]
MRIASPSRPMIMSRTDKEARLKDFIGEVFAARGEDPAREICLTLFVRNPDSPAARALHAAWSEGLIEGARILLIVGDTTVEEPGTPSVLDISGADCRILAEPSFGPAHEQLTVGHTRVWIGDCFRRDPAKRDAFELYHGNDTQNCVFAVASFDKLWKRARILKPRHSEHLSPEIIAAQSDDPNALPRNPRH